MIGVNQVNLLGRVAADVELRTTKTGKSVAKIVIAIPGRIKGEATVEYFEVTAWNKTAEACGQFVTKGMPIYVEGRLNKSVWDAADGTKRSTYRVVARQVVFLGSKPEAAPAELAEEVAQEEEA